MKAACHPGSTCHPWRAPQAPRPRPGPARAAQEAAGFAFETRERETYMHEGFTQRQLAGDGASQAQHSFGRAAPGAAGAPPPPITLQYNHTALPVKDIALLTRFYTEVLGMEQLPRPNFPFGGAWLRAGGFFLHLIAEDPTVPAAAKSNSSQPESRQPCVREPWHIRRGRHTAFEVASLAEAEARLEHFGIGYDKFIVPGTEAAQIFLYDPEWNGVELGEAYREVAEHLKSRMGAQA